MSVLYPGWGSNPVIQTKDWTGDLYVNPTSDLTLVQFVADPDFGHAFATTMKVTDDWQPVDGKLFAGPLLKADSYPTAPGDVYVRIPVKGPALEPVGPGRGFLCWEFESFPFNGPPLASMNITADPALTKDTAIDPATGGPFNHWVGGFGPQSDPSRFYSWMGPRVVPGQVVNFDVHYVISHDGTVGGVELWCNGVQQKFYNGNTRLYYPTLDATNSVGPHRLVLCSYSGTGSGGAPFTKPATVTYGAPVFGTTLADVQPPQHVWRLHNANQTDRDYSSVDDALAAAKPIVAAGKAVFLTRES